MLKLKQLKLEQNSTEESTHLEIEFSLDKLLINRAGDFVNELKKALTEIESTLLDVPELVAPQEQAKPKKRGRKKKPPVQAVDFDTLQKVVDNYIDTGKPGAMKRKRDIFNFIAELDSEACMLEDLDPKCYEAMLAGIKNLLDGSRTAASLIEDDDDDEV